MADRRLRVVFDGHALSPGDLVQVRISESDDYDLAGRLAG